MTSSVGVSPGPGARAPAVRSIWWRSRLDTTPARLRLLLAVLVILSLAWGVVAALTANQHASAAASVVAVSEPLSLDAEQIYQGLSDADATAANAFLAGGLEPAAARQRYNADITQAAVRIEAASALVGSSAARTQLPGPQAAQASDGSAIGDDLATLSAELPVYADEAGTARADNRLGLPLGAAYLREASTLMRGTLLPAASDIYTRESRRLTSSSAQATGLPLIVVAVLIGLGVGYLLYRASRRLTRHTHRVVNYGLLLAAVAGAVSLVWLGGALAGGRAGLLRGPQGASRPRPGVVPARARTRRSPGPAARRCRHMPMRASPWWITAATTPTSRTFSSRPSCWDQDLARCSPRWSPPAVASQPTPRPGIRLIGSCVRLTTAGTTLRRCSRRCRARPPRSSRCCPARSATASMPARPSSPPVPARVGTRSPPCLRAWSWRRC